MPSASYSADESFARQMDERDPLRGYRALFHMPRVAEMVRRAPASLEGASASDEREVVYLTGNSLGLCPKAAAHALHVEMDDWARLGVEGHLHGANPWLSYHEIFREMGARLVGAVPGEVVMMNSLTVNLHLLMVSFYRPTRERYRIVIEDSAFPSDSYAVRSQADFHAASAGFDPARAIVRLKPREGEACLRTEDIIAFLEREGRDVALVMLGGVNYLTGQWFQMEEITRAGHKAGAVVGWDLAHGAGNVPVKLHDWNADFACWCSYKYLNAGPGAVAGAFVHERHASNTALPRFAGWWGNEPATRFKMGPEFTARAGADGWQLSNPPILAMAPLKSSLEIFDKAGMAALREKSLLLTGYLAWLIDRINERAGRATIRVLTPRDPGQRGCHLSLSFPANPRAMLGALKKEGVVCDFREPDVIRAAPVPLYNTFHDVWRFAQVLGKE